MNRLTLARERFAAGDFPGAIALLEAASPSLEGALLLGVCLVRVQRNEDARRVFNEILAKDANCYEALTWMAILNKNRASIQDAVCYAERAISVRPDDAAGYGTLGGCYLYLRTPLPAVEALGKAVELAPDVAENHHNLGLAYQMVQNHRKAIEHFRIAISLAPRAPQNYLALAAQYSLFGIAGKAIECLEQGLMLMPQSAALHSAIGAAFATIRNDEAAEHHHRKALELSPDTRGAYASWLIGQGRFTESEALFEKMLCEGGDPCFAYYGLMQSRKLTSEDEAFLAEMEATAGQPDMPTVSRLYIHYALGKAHEQLKNFERAMWHFDKANAIAFHVHNAGSPLDRDGLRKNHEHVRACYERMPQAPAEGGSPIFIVGMIRSGTTLLEQIVSSHGQVAAAGELRFWIEESSALALTEGAISESRLRDLAEEYLTYTELIAGRAEFITDKMPLNFAYLGIMHRVFPQAKFLHIKRNPIDTCLSIYTTYFGKGPQFAYDKENIVAYYRQYLEVMEYWREVLPKGALLEIEYEQLIDEPERVIREVVSFCGLPWDKACLHHDENESAIHTPSRWQARQPLYRTSTERWRKYEPWLGDFALLGLVAPVAGDRGGL